MRLKRKIYLQVRHDEINIDPGDDFFDNDQRNFISDQINEGTGSGQTMAFYFGHLINKSHVLWGEVY